MYVQYISAPPLEKLFVLTAGIIIPLLIISDWRLHWHSSTRLNVFITAGSVKACNCVHRVSTCTVCTTFVPCTYTWHTLFECVQVQWSVTMTCNGLSLWHARVWRDCVLTSKVKSKCYSMNQKSRVSAFQWKSRYFDLYITCTCTYTWHVWYL